MAGFAHRSKTGFGGARFNESTSTHLKGLTAMADERQLGPDGGCRPARE